MTLHRYADSLAGRGWSGGVALALGLALLAISSGLPALGQGTAFHYQGRLNHGGVPYAGQEEFQPSLWDAEPGGNRLATN